MLQDFAESVELFADEAKKRGKRSWWYFNLTPSVAKMLDWYVRYFPGAAYSTIGEIQRQAHTTWDATPADTLRALRLALSLDGKLTEQQRQTYFALLEPHENAD
ncbi:hypothetical protein [Streptomyces sp. NPDC020362]|uniref:hypothetical protein n=1 Tax=unclassified Streptomyces TaxID=2593676 RepID=UPI000ADFDE16